MILVRVEHMSLDLFVLMNVHQAFMQMVLDAQLVILLMRCAPSVQAQVYVLLVQVPNMLLARAV